MMRLDELDLQPAAPSLQKVVLKLRDAKANIYRDSRHERYHIFVYSVQGFRAEYADLDPLMAQCVLNELLAGRNPESNDGDG